MADEHEEMWKTRIDDLKQYNGNGESFPLTNTIRRKFYARTNIRRYGKLEKAILLL